MIRTLLLSLAGLVLVAAVGLSFYLLLGQSLPLSRAPQDWALFGDYFGGVAGPLLAFLSVLLIIYTVHQQSIQIETTRQENLKRDLLLYVSRADEEIDRWLQRGLHAAQHPVQVELGDIVWGAVDHSYVNNKEFSVSLVRLHKLICHFSVAIALYRDNIDTYYVFRHYREKALELIEFLEKHLDKMQPMTGPSLAVCKNHLSFEAGA